MNDDSTDGSGADDGVSQPEDDGAEDDAAVADDEADVDDAPTEDDGAALDDAASSDEVAAAVASGEALPLVLDGQPDYHRYVRLTHEQWENSVRDNLRMTGPTGQLEALSPDALFGTYSNDERQLYVAPGLYADYERAAETLAAQYEDDPAKLAEVSPDDDPDAFIATVGRRFYRRPLTNDELARYREIFDTGAGLESAVDGFSNGAGLVLEVLLQAPNFLYRIEDANDGAPLSGYELATKLAYFITNTTPSDALLDAAAAGDLDTPQGVEEAALELIQTADAAAAMRRFHGETYSFDAYRGIAKEASLGYDASSNAALEEASYLFFDRIFSEGLGVREILLSDVAFADASLAPLYGFDPPAAGEYSELKLGQSRPGFFTQLPFLMLHAANLEPEPITRGTVINYSVLCADVPQDVASASPPAAPDPDQTNRQRVEEYTSGDGCAGCHVTYINPLGFAFENFDGMGQHRELDNGDAIDTSGSYPFVEGTQTFDGAEQLMALLAESEQAHTCYAKHLSQFALARQLAPEDQALVDSLGKLSKDSDGAASIVDLILALVSSGEFRTRTGGNQ